MDATDVSGPADIVMGDSALDVTELPLPADVVTEDSADGAELTPADAVEDTEPGDTVPVSDTPVDKKDDIPSLADAPDAVLLCDEKKIEFTQDNPKKFEFYELCVSKGQEAEVIPLDATLNCGVGGVFAKCGGGQTACHGDLDFVMATKTISDAKWSELCALSSLDGVSKIAGGYFL